MPPIEGALEGYYIPHVTNFYCGVLLLRKCIVHQSDIIVVVHSMEVERHWYVENIIQ